MIGLVGWQKLVKSWSGGCLERSGDSKPNRRYNQNYLQLPTVENLPGQSNQVTAVTKAERAGFTEDLLQLFVAIWIINYAVCCKLASRQNWGFGGLRGWGGGVELGQDTTFAAQQRDLRPALRFACIN